MVSSAGDDDFHVGRGQESVLRRQFGIADDPADARPIGKEGQSRLAELGAVGDDGGFDRAFHHRTFGFDEQQVAVVESAFGQPGHAEEQVIDVKSLKSRGGVLSECDAGLRVDEPANEDEFDVSTPGEQTGDRQTVCEHLHRTPEKVFGDFEGRGAAVEQNGLTVFDEFGGRDADLLFLRCLGLTAIVKSRQRVW